MYSIDGKRIQNDKLTFMTYTDGQDFDNIRNEEYRKNNTRRLLRALSSKSIIRYEGNDRIDTSVEISKRNFSSAENVIVTNAWKPSDALAATALAKSLNAPILYVNKDELPSVNVNIKMYKKWKIKMYNLGSTIHQLSYHQ